jgi:Ca-activated chloride channel family protein
MTRARRVGWRWRSIDQLPMGRRCGTLLLCALATGGWFGAERDRAAEGNRRYDAGQYDEAATAYGEGLIDYPDSRRLRFNLGAAQYREGKFADAIATLEKLLPAAEDEPRRPAADDAELSAQAAYNVGNARFRLGRQVEEQDPQQALALYDQALADYKRSMGAAPEDEAAKFNHEFVERHLLALKERLEQQQQERQEQQQKQQEQQPQQGQDEQESQQGEQQPQEGQEPQGGDEQKQADDEQGGGEQQPEPAEQPEAANGAQREERDAEAEPQGGRNGANAAQPAQGAPSHQGGEGAAPDPPTAEETGRSEAQALIDTARGEEVEPSELRPRAGAAGVGEPAQDW